MDNYLNKIQNGSSNTGIWTSNRALLLWATLATMLLWFVPYSNYLLYPLRLFVTFVHESGHAVAAVLTGAGVSSLHVHTDGSGVTYTGSLPLWDWLMLSSGYLGTAIFGAALLQVGRIRSLKNPGRVALYVISGFILMVTLLWANNPFANPNAKGPDFFTLPVGLLLTGIFFCLARFTPARVSNFLASFLAVQCGLNALGDLRTLLYLTSSGFGDNDAVFMAKEYLIPSFIWAGLWAIMAAAILGLSLWSLLKPSSKGSQGVVPAPMKMGSL